jgi:hypothetical protein
LIGMSTTLMTEACHPQGPCRLQRSGAGEVVEGEDPLVPAGAGEALGLVERQADAGGDHQDVVGQLGAVLQHDRVAVEVDPLDRLQHEVDVLVQLGLARAHDLVVVGETEGHEEQAGLVDVVVVLVDDRDLHITVLVVAVQTVGGEGAARTAAEDHDPPRRSVRIHGEPSFRLPCSARRYP